MSPRASVTTFTTMLCCIFSFSALAAAEKDWTGSLEVMVDEKVHQSGSALRVTLEAMSKGKVAGGVTANREAAFNLIPYRYNIFDDAAIQLTAKRSSANAFNVSLPDVPAGWYLLVTAVENDEGVIPQVDRALADKNGKHLIDRTIIAVAGKSASPVRVHTERARAVFSPGEEIRFFASARGASSDAVVLALYPAFAGGKPTAFAKGSFSAKAGQTQTLAFDLSAEASAAVMPGDYKLVAIVGGKPVDRMSVRFITGETTSGGARWAHNFPFGYGGGMNSSPALPQQMNNYKHKKMVSRILKRVHNASLWVSFFGNNFPVVGPNQKLPLADDARLPAPAAFYRPSMTHAFQESLMSEGVALGVSAGYGENYKAEVYMPIPGAVDERIDVMARKYLTAGLGGATFPHFVAIYADYYGHMAFTGAGEMSSDETREEREAIWEGALKAAGIKGAKKPLRFELNRKNLPQKLKDLLKDKAKSKAWDKHSNNMREEHGKNKNWFKDNYKTVPEKQKIWNGFWQAAGVSPVPQPPTYVPLPELDAENKAKFGPQASYEYASYALRSLERAYGRFTDMIEEELPAVMTIHNKGTMNHSSVSHAWTGVRTPNVDPAYLDGGATAISVSEWNLDSVPKPYFLTTFYNRPLVDRGHPVYRSGLWKQMGMPTRWMRDSVFWGGRQIHTYFDQAGNMTWSHQGSDQTTYAANERMASVTEFLSYYSDLFNNLQPVREVGLYVPPMGGPWGTGVTRGHYVAMIASLMSDHQVHMVSHGDIASKGLDKYDIIYAPSVHHDLYPFEKQGFKDYINQGGNVVVSQSPNYYHDEADYKRYGMSWKEVPQIDSRTGEVRKNRDGSVRTTKEWTETPEKWAQLTKEVVWKDFPKGVSAAAINVHDNYTHLEDGKPAKWTGSHWTGHHKWAGYRGAALYQYQKLAEAFNKLTDPVVKKDKPEVFTNLTSPEDGESAGQFLFVSNWTLPDHPDLFTKRIPQGFFKSGVMPTRAALSVRSPETAAVYDLIAGKKLEHRSNGDRIEFEADLDSVEGRIYALYPQVVSGVRLQVPTSLKVGQRFVPVMETLGDGGQPMNVLSSARVRVLGADGRVVTDLRRAVPGSGALPELTAPFTAGQPMVLEVVNTVTGHVARAEIPVVGKGIPSASPAAAVTVHRGDRIHEWLQQNKQVTIVTDAGWLSFKDGKTTVSGANKAESTAQGWARKLSSALQGAGVRSKVVSSKDGAKGPLHAHPWTGKMAGYRTRSTVPNIHIPGATIVIGNPDSAYILNQMDRAHVAPRSLRPDNVGNGKAVVAWASRALDPQGGTVIIAARDEAGAAAAIAQLASIAKTKPGADSFYEARERMRFAWAPTEVVEYKAKLGLKPALRSGGTYKGSMTSVDATPGWRELVTILGTPIFSIDASKGGVAVGTKSWVKPTGIVKADGTIAQFFGGEGEIAPRDVAINTDGTAAAAGYSLLGRVAGYLTGQGTKWRHVSGIVYKSNPFSWDTFKDSDRQLAGSPDNKLFVAHVGAEKIAAYDANTGKERWSLPMTGTADRPTGAALPEIAFSREGSRVLVSTFQDIDTTTFTFTVSKMEKDDKGNYNKRKKYDDKVSVQVQGKQTTLRLVDTATGKSVWDRITDVTYYDVKTGKAVWKVGKMPALEEEYRGRWYKWEGKEQPLAANGKTPQFDVHPMPFWHLYSTVGPNGKWTIAGTRDANFSLLDEQGKTLRTFTSRQLPKALDPGSMIPPSFRAGSDPKRVLAFAPQGRTAFLYEVQVGTVAERADAQRRQEENLNTIRAMEAVLKNTKNYGNFGKEQYLNDFAKKLVIPADLKGDLVALMKRVPAERRAGRKRDYRFFQKSVEKIKQRLFEEDKPALDKAVGFVEKQRIVLPDMIVDGEANAAMQTAYIAMWDGTVRAYDLASGAEKWSVSIIGGAQLDYVEGEALYAGGSRGDVYRINPATGAIEWQVNITEATNALD